MRALVPIAVLVATLLPGGDAVARGRCTEECQRVLGAAVSMCSGRVPADQVTCVEQLTAEHRGCRGACDDARLGCLSDCQRGRAAEVQACARRYEGGTEEREGCVADADQGRDECADRCGVDVPRR
jgi:hypothetical protein